MGGYKIMKKYIAPEMNITKFDVEDVITTSVTGTKEIYGKNDASNIQEVDFSKIFA